MLYSLLDFNSKSGLFRLTLSSILERYFTATIFHPRAREMCIKNFDNPGKLWPK